MYVQLLLGSRRTGGVIHNNQKVASLATNNFRTHKMNSIGRFANPDTNWASYDCEFQGENGIAFVLGVYIV